MEQEKTANECCSGTKDSYLSEKTNKSFAHFFSNAYNDSAIDKKSRTMIKLSLAMVTGCYP